MATIEPRLIHLLNESTSTPHHAHADLPPLHALPIHAHGDRPLPRLDRDVSRHAASHPYPIRLLLDDSDSGESRHGHGAYRDDSPEGPDDVYHKKRSRATMHVKDDFVQLPQPLKKQKATQQALVMPPIINGLHEPPPHAALFPPISSTTYENDSQMKMMHDFNNHSSPDERSHRRGSSETDKSSSKGRNITPAHVLLAWAQIGGHTVIPKSVTASRIHENFQEVELDQEDIDRLNKIGNDKHRFNIPIGYNPKWNVNIFDSEREKVAATQVVL
ncbi:hypothetical protein NLG97_g1615 [Lecanicillium saksenae]|uniref:Uncharacterized protein n=1 Tax=Lecanicillium saksenae TaxID=468837 RepID=A0ACC1R396_9HYPO|nr:hypothetical protein NLG97_g1615 [Lecanicillium saksenae]